MHHNQCHRYLHRDVWHNSNHSALYAAAMWQVGILNCCKLSSSSSICQHR